MIKEIILIGIWIINKIKFAVKFALCVPAIETSLAVAF